MTRLPRTARALLDRFGCESALIGDLEESLHDGRSVAWCWTQVVGAVLESSVRSTAARPVYTLRGVVVGWVTLLATFALVDTPLINALRLEGYRTGDWAPFYRASLVLTYVGFALSAAVTARLHRRTPAVLLMFTGSVLAALAAGAVLTAAGPTPVPHMLFPLVSVALPYQWRSGFLLAPTVIVLAGYWAMRRPHPTDVSAR